MFVKEIMTKNVRTIAPGTSLRAAARLMATEDCGILPIAKNDRLIGMVSDRDIALRAVAESKDPNVCTVAEIMTDDVKYLFDDETIEDLARNLSGLQLRRLPVVNREKRLVGIVSLADLATKCDGVAAAAALRAVSAPTPTEAPIAG
jgi:CBS domain-containing protein